MNSCTVNVRTLHETRKKVRIPRRRIRKKEFEIARQDVRDEYLTIDSLRGEKLFGATDAKAEQGAGVKHQCHARNCQVEVPPEMLMCRRHWFMVPKTIRNEVWLTYRPGQCDDKNPSKEWHVAADRAINAVFQRENS